MYPVVVKEVPLVRLAVYIASVVLRVQLVASNTQLSFVQVG